MTDEAITKLGPAFAGYLSGYRDCFLQKRTATHFDNYCRGLLSDLPRKSVEPIALACGTAVRTLQEFLITADWDHEATREKLQRRVAQVLDQLPGPPIRHAQCPPGRRDGAGAANLLQHRNLAGTDPGAGSEVKPNAEPVGGCWRFG